MLTIELINNSIPRLKLQDTVSKALQLINDFRVTHLPVVADDKYLGLISEEDLLDAKQEKMPIELMQETFITAAVHDNEHFLNAVNYCNQHDTTVVPVVNEENE
ncbi:CBS domain-containing protein, partial [Ferruginibacter sp.]